MATKYIPINSMTYQVIRQEFIQLFGDEAWETHWNNHSDDDVMLAMAVASIVQKLTQVEACGAGTNDSEKA